MNTKNILYSYNAIQSNIKGISQTKVTYHSFPCEGFSSSTRIIYNKQLNNLREKLNRRILRPLRNKKNVVSTRN